MSEENKNSGPISKEKAVSFVSAVSIIGMCFALYTGVFDRGTSTGSFNEKLIFIEKQLTRSEMVLADLTKKLESNSAADNEIRIEVIKLTGIVEQLRYEQKETKREMELLRGGGRIDR
ncbi:hypothetical protein Ab1vBOLIVR5_gp225 [Agrobacterium phage OLIVR5]|uniref:Uncharacterized protein n=3 Tax=Caudoviricetes TaxID=2731619 RepID=A0A858MTN5_9CAUD|nr:hypothetical protein KNU99_gp176 [Agrobacterium phage OLIVR5]QIW87873.1 hypothetical protein Ab1vBOLIVR5_gp225 [Agrobacterium phage OLIVR5]QIW88138.1 hypothetical protein Ab1vBOLIVR6_gp231 [Agrobacterium phage OLIVR6]